MLLLAGAPCDWILGGRTPFPRVADGVAPSASPTVCNQPLDAGKLSGRSLRRDAANRTPEARAPHFNCPVPL